MYTIKANEVMKKSMLLVQHMSCTFSLKRVFKHIKTDTQNYLPLSSPKNTRT